jgi:hypothetical protein
LVADQFFVRPPGVVGVLMDVDDGFGGLRGKGSAKDQGWGRGEKFASRQHL